MSHLLLLHSDKPTLALCRSAKPAPCRMKLAKPTVPYSFTRSSSWFGGVHIRLCGDLVWRHLERIEQGSCCVVSKVICAMDFFEDSSVGGKRKAWHDALTTFPR